MTDIPATTGNLYETYTQNILSSDLDDKLMAFVCLEELMETANSRTKETSDSCLEFKENVFKLEHTLKNYQIFWRPENRDKIVYLDTPFYDRLREMLPKKTLEYIENRYYLDPTILENPTIEFFFPHIEFEINTLFERLNNLKEDVKGFVVANLKELRGKETAGARKGGLRVPEKKALEPVEKEEPIKEWREDIIYFNNTMTKSQFNGVNYFKIRHFLQKLHGKDAKVTPEIKDFMDHFWAEFEKGNVLPHIHYIIKPKREVKERSI